MPKKKGKDMRLLDEVTSLQTKISDMQQQVIDHIISVNDFINNIICI